MTSDQQAHVSDQWLHDNATYLGLAMARLRGRLANLDQEGTGEPLSEDQVRELEEAADTFPPPALVLLGDAFELSPFERSVVLLAAATELHTGIAHLCARAQGDTDRPYPTFALAMTVSDDADWSALLPGGRLRGWRLVEVDQDPGLPLTSRRISLDERLLHFIKGLNALDERLTRVVRPLPDPDGELPESQTAMVEEIDTALHNLPGKVIQLVGAAGASKRTVVSELARRQGLHAVELRAGSIPSIPDDTDDLARLWRRESRLLPVALFVTSEGDDLTVAQVAAVRLLTDRVRTPLFLDVPEVCVDLAQDSAVFDVMTPTPDERNSLWTSSLGGEVLQIADRLAAEFDLDGSEIARIADEAKRVGDGDPARGAWTRSKSVTRPQLEALARRLSPVATWDDIVLTDEPSRLLRAIADQARNRAQVYDRWGWRQRSSRGLGITALFTGESGTGKTMAAEVLANDLSLDLYHIDLSAVVSKYIGETEKNLRKLFDAAERGGVMLLFDEADALFGKRTEVKDSHDRYANIEVNYLLQRMETFRGLAILATNMRTALDQAFTRRLRFIVPFTLPARPEREQIWGRAFPDRVPLDGVDASRLARLSISGALIHSIAMHASFLAAAAGTPVTMDLVLDAARVELRKADRPTNEVDAV
jgi:hypothetical protein